MNKQDEMVKRKPASGIMSPKVTNSGKNLVYRKLSIIFAKIFVTKFLAYGKPIQIRFTR